MATPADDLAALLARVPKTDLHCHLVGTLRAQTLGELARRHAIALPRPAESLYDFSDFYDFLQVLTLSAAVMRDREDFARVAYEALEDGWKSSRMVHAELLFNPQYHYPHGVDYRTMVEGLAAGLNRAKQDFGVSGLLVASFDRVIAPAAALEILDHVLAWRHELVVGIGLDGAERNGPPATFAEVYARAAGAGLKRTAHVCEDNQTLQEAPPSNYAVCKDVLGCDRLDHGYNLLADPAMIERARDEGLFFGTCTVTSVTRNLERRRQAIGRMVDLGLNVTVNTDDPQMFKTDLTDSWQRLFAGRRDWGFEQARRFALAGVEASWLDDEEKRRLRTRMEHELQALSTN
jgi:adenosine deaminase